MNIKLKNYFYFIIALSTVSIYYITRADKTNKKRSLMSYVSEEEMYEQPTPSFKNNIKIAERASLDKADPTSINSTGQNPAINNANVLNTKTLEDTIPLELQQLEQRVEEDKKNDQAPIKKPVNNENDKIEFHFENADLQNLVTQIETLYDVTFIPDDAISPLGPGGKAIKGNKISFKTQKPLSKKEAWDLFITFLNIAGFAVVPEADPKRYRIVSIEKAQKSPVPVYIGVDPSVLEEIRDNDQMIRFVYFIENTKLETLTPIVDSLRSTASSLVPLQELNAFLITDKAYNIKTLMKIVKELDKVSMPQAMSILKLQSADALEVKQLYDTLAQTDDKSITARLFPARKQPTSLYFPESTRMIAEPRTNSLILLGTRDAINKIEEFIKKNVDVALDKPYSPLHTYQLKYADAESIANIMNEVTKFGRETEAGKSGGVRGGDKYLKPMTFIAEKATNQLIVKGDADDFFKAKQIIEKLDEEQPQVAIEVLILAVDLNKQKELGAQLRSKEPGPSGLIGKNVEFQTSGFLGAGIQEKTNGVSGSRRLLADLVDLATRAGAGNTVLTLGEDLLGVWGIFRALQTVSNAQIISNPFITATSNTKSTVSIGETRRAVTATIIGGTQPTNTFDDLEAKLEVSITPQINSDGMIIMELTVDIVDFVGAAGQLNQFDRNHRTITTKTIVVDREVLALGGFIQNKTGESLSKTPLLGDIPILGWLFKNKSKQAVKTNLLILISSRIIDSAKEKDIKRFTSERIDGYYGTMQEMRDVSEKKDPIYKVFFEPKEDDVEKTVESFIFERGRNEKIAHNNKRKQKRSGNKKRSRKNNKKTTTVAAHKKTKTKSKKKPLDNHNEDISPAFSTALANKQQGDATTAPSSTQTSKIATIKKDHLKRSITDFVSKTDGGITT